MSSVVLQGWKTRALGMRQDEANYPDNSIHSSMNTLLITLTNSIHSSMNTLLLRHTNTQVLGTSQGT